MNEDLKRYELFGWDYAHNNPVDERSVQWYLDLADLSGGPVLELACGTGRLACRLAEVGFEVTGVDLCDEMLDIARENAAKLTQYARRRVTLLRADMRDFHLDRRFGLVVLADNSFRELADRESQIACLRCVLDHLRGQESTGESDPGGTRERAGKGRAIFAMTERRFDPMIYTRSPREFDWSGPIRDPATGCVIRRRGRFGLDSTGKWIEGEFEYEVTAPDGRVSHETLPVMAPVVRAEDYLELFREAGLTAKACADYERRPADGSETLTCFVCVRSAERR